MWVTRRPDSGVLAVVAGEQPQDVQRHLAGQVLASVMEAVEHDLGLALVDADVVAHLGRPDGRGPDTTCRW